MKSVISATDSGWLSLTPRSSLRRATIAAMAIISLSFSRGVRFIGRFPNSSIQPGAWQRAAERAYDGTKIPPQARAILGAEPRHCKAVPGRHANLATESLLANAQDNGFVA